MTDVLQLLQSHRSIRRFRTDPLPDGLLTEIVRCGQQAASSSNLQAYRILRITDPALRAVFYGVKTSWSRQNCQLAVFSAILSQR